MGKLVHALADILCQFLHSVHWIMYLLCKKKACYSPLGVKGKN